MACNCGCSDKSSSNDLLQIIPRPTSTASAPAPVVSSTLTTEIKISGMTCSHCVASVTEELKEVSGISNIDIILDAQGISTAVLTSTAPLDHAILREAVGEAGYAVESINN